MLTKAEHVALEAFENETEGMHKTLVSAGLHYVRAWKNAQIYADMATIDVDRLRKAMTKLSGVTDADDEKELLLCIRSYETP